MMIARATDDRYLMLTACQNITRNDIQRERKFLLLAGRRVSSQTVKNRRHKVGL